MARASRPDVGDPPLQILSTVGRNAFAHEAGIHQDGVLKAAITYEIMTPESIGRASNELVLGVVIGHQARAYPINMLTGPSREIFNDELGGQAIAATW